MSVKIDSEGTFHTIMSLSSKATVGQLKSIIKQVDQWSTFFEGIVLDACYLGDSESRAQLTVCTPILNLKWTIVSDFSLIESDDEVVIKGSNHDSGDWSDTSYTVVIRPSKKEGRFSSIEISTQSGYLPIPQPSLVLVLQAVKPLVKKCIHRAVSLL